MDEGEHQEWRSYGKRDEVIRGIAEGLLACSEEIEKRNAEKQHQHRYNKAYDERGIEAEGAYAPYALPVILSKQPRYKHAAALPQNVADCHQEREERRSQ